MKQSQNCEPRFSIAQKVIPRLFILVAFAIAAASTLFIFTRTSATDALTISTIAPSTGPTTGGTNITITGTDLIREGINIVQMSASQQHVLAVDDLGNLYIWGNSVANSGLLGDGIAEAHGQSTPMILNVDGRGDLSRDTKIAAAYAGSTSSVAIDTDGNIYTWGTNTAGQLGTGGGTADAELLPKRINIDGNGDFTSETKIKAIASSATFVVAVDMDGAVYAWGNNSAGQISNGLSGSGATVTTPHKITGNGGAIDNVQIETVTAGTNHVLALDNDGKVYAWGGNGNGRTGTGPAGGTVLYPTAISLTGAIDSNTVITSIQAGDVASFATDEDGNLYAWGASSYGLLLNGETTATVSEDVPILLTGVDNGDFTATTKIKKIATRAGSQFIMAIDFDDNLYGWGLSNNGRLGTTPTNAVDGFQLSPLRTNTTDNGDMSDTTDISHVAVGLGNAYATDSNGDAYAWGTATYYMLGNNEGTGGTALRLAPTNIIQHFDTIARLSIIFTANNGGTTSRCLPYYISSTVVRCTMSAHPEGSGSITFKNEESAATENNAFTYYAPISLLATSEIIGEVAGGTELTLFGAGFAAGMTVTVGGKNCTNLNVISDIRLTCETPDHNAGLVDIIATKNDQSSTLKKSFTFVQPASISSSTPISGPSTGGTDIIITGNNLTQDQSEIVKVSTAQLHSLALDNYGNIYTWGGTSAANAGALGDGNLDNHSVMTPLQINIQGNGDFNSGTRIKEIATGTSFSMAIDTNGDIYTWGQDSSGQLGNGDGSTDATASPQKINVAGNPKFVKIAAGVNGALAIDEDGNLYSWGANNYGQTANGTSGASTNVTSIQKVTGAPGSAITDGVKIIDIALGSNHGLAVDTNGMLYGWGYGNNGRVGDGITSNDIRLPKVINLNSNDAWNISSRAVAVGVNDASSFAIDVNGDLYSWGANAEGRLGLGDIAVRYAPTRVYFGSDANYESTFTITSVVKRALPGGSSALDADGNIYTWGSYLNSRAGSPLITANQLTPFRINHDDNGAFSSSTQIRVLNQGADTGYVIGRTGALYAWGYGNGYRLGNGSVTSQVSPIETTSFFPDHIAPSIFFASDDNDPVPAQCAVTTSSTTTIKCVTGAHPLGLTSIHAQNTFETKTSPDGFTYIKPLLIHSVSEISGPTTGGTALTIRGIGFTAGISVTIGDVPCANLSIDSNTVLSCETSASSNAGLVDITITRDSQTATLKKAFTYFDPISINTITPNTGPGDGGTDVTITGSNFNTLKPEIVQIGAGNQFGVALDNYGNIYTWGYSTYGVLGNGTTTPTVRVPTRINVDGNGDFDKNTQIRDISVGPLHTMALDTEGNVYTWGQGTLGRLGHGDEEHVLRPKKLSFPNDVKIQKIYAGHAASIALDFNGNVYTWGNNYYAALGNGSNGTATNEFVPTLVSGNGGDITLDTKIVDIAIGGVLGLALDEDGFWYSWGQGTQGIGGDGTNSGWRSFPKKVQGNHGDITVNTIIKSVHALAGTGYAIDVNNNLFAWGVGGLGQIGNNNTVTTPNPFRVNTDVNANGDMPAGTRIESTITGGGTYYIMAIDTTGNLYSWGQQASGRLGIGDVSENQLVPRRVNFDNNGDFDSNTKVRTGAVGISNTFAIGTDGRVYAWGAGSSYGLGNNSTSSLSSPAEITSYFPDSVELFVTLATDDDPNPANCYFVSIIDNNTLSCRTSAHEGGEVSVTIDGPGNKNTATLIDGFTYITPLIVENISPIRGLTSGGTTVTITGSGFNSSVRVYIGGVACSNRIVTSSTTITCTTGAHAQGMTDVVVIGNGQTITLRNSFIYSNPIIVEDITPDSGITTGGTPVTISGSGFASTDVPIVRMSMISTHGLAIDDQGNVYAWGNNSSGQLGNGQKEDAALNNGVACDSDELCSLPVKISGLAGGAFADSPKIVSVSAGNDHSMAADEDGKVYVWGAPGNGRLGLGTYTGPTNYPILLSDVSILNGVKIVQVVAAGSNSYALDDQGNVYAWGYNSNGVVGDGTPGGTRASPVKITGIAGNGDFASSPRIVDITSTGSHVLALDSTGNVYAWGANTYGQIGNGTQTVPSNPTRISGLAGGALADSPRIVSIATGESHTSYAVDDTGAVYAWGLNVNGVYRYLGAGSDVANILMPVKITGVAGSALTSSVKIVEVAARASAAIAVDENGAVYGWGNNASNRTGIVTPSTTNILLPTQLTHLPGNTASGPTIISLGATPNGALALDSLGNIYTWGTINHGDGTSSNRGIPTIINGTAGGALEVLTLSVTFDPDGAPAICNINSVTDTTIDCTTSPHTSGEGLVDVKVANRISSFTVEDGFDYQDLFINLAIDGDNEVDLSIIPDILGTTSSEQIDLITQTNNIAGYSMHISMSTNETSLLGNGTNAIQPASGSFQNPALLGINTWGFALPATQAYLPSNGFDPDYTGNPSTLKWAPIPALASPTLIKSTTVPTTVGGSSTQVFFAARADLTLPADAYTGTVVITVVSN